jgi:uncharacterized protein
VNNKEIISRTETQVRHLLSSDTTGHDWWHIHRVRQNAKRIGVEEGADMFIVELSALLHDIADWKFHDGDETAGPREARIWLEQLNVGADIINHICQIIEGISFKGAGVSGQMKTKEGMVVQDADRLDALGAIGIARAFAYGGYKGRPIHDPNVPPEQHETFEQYKKSSGPTINHFYEKLLLLKDQMNTPTGKTMAEERHAFLVTFLDRFHAEWQGRA